MTKDINEYIAERISEEACKKLADMDRKRNTNSRKYKHRFREESEIATGDMETILKALIEIGKIAEKCNELEDRVKLEKCRKKIFYSAMNLYTKGLKKNALKELEKGSDNG